MNGLPVAGKKYTKIPDTAWNETGRVSGTGRLYRRHIGQIENNRGIPSLEMTVNIANALHTTVDQLVIDSLDCPEIVYLRDMEQRIRSMPMPIKLLTCEILQDVMEIIEKAQTYSIPDK